MLLLALRRNQAATGALAPSHGKGSQFASAVGDTALL
jgi:hypothetical protein